MTQPNPGQQARSAAAKKARDFKCAKADFYKGLRPPKCNGGAPCDTCRATYEETQRKGTARNVVDKRTKGSQGLR